MKAWLKGGLIGLGILILISVIIGLVNLIIKGGPCPDWIINQFPGSGGAMAEYVPSFKACFNYSIIILIFPIIFFNKIINITNLYLAFIISLLFWFFIGTLIGWIIGKIKNRKQGEKK